MEQIAAIETTYKGYRFRSRLEARWAVFFDKLGLPWEYEPEGYKLSDGTCYLPDFYFPNFKGTGLFAEVKPFLDESNLLKSARLALNTHTPVLLCIGIPECKIYPFLSSLGQCGTAAPFMKTALNGQEEFVENFPVIDERLNITKLVEKVFSRELSECEKVVFDRAFVEEHWNGYAALNKLKHNVVSLDQDQLFANFLLSSDGTNNGAEGVVEVNPFIVPEFYGKDFEKARHSKGKFTVKSQAFLRPFVNAVAAARGARFEFADKHTTV